MATKAIVTTRARAAERGAAAAAASVRTAGVTVEHLLPDGGMLVTGDENQLSALEDSGMRVKVLPDTNILQVGNYRVDTDSNTESRTDNRGLQPAAAGLAERAAETEDLDVPAAEAASWPHHLVQLSGPPNADWVRAIEQRGVDVVDPISQYGLFVMADPDTAEGLRTLDFVTWVGPMKPAYRLAPGVLERSGRIQYLNVGVYPADQAASTRAAITGLGGETVDQWDKEAAYRDSYAVLMVELDRERVPDLARLPFVRWIQYQEPGLTADDERSCQIVAGRVNGAPPPNTEPMADYGQTLTRFGVDGTGITVGLCDSGVDTHTNGTLHQDLRGRLAFFEDVTAGTTTVDRNGHGTHVAGIAVGAGVLGRRDPQGFLLGQGVAPGARFGSINPVDTDGGPGTGPVAQFTKLMVKHGAHVMNNSWRQGGSNGYTEGAALVDRLVRDPNGDNLADPDKGYLVIVFSAGNAGPNARTITPPKEAKNPIVVGNSLTHRPREGEGDDIRGVNSSSSRGPARDNRIVPHIVAPGTDIVSARSTADAQPATAGVQRPLSEYRDTGLVRHDDYSSLTGTSMAAPHVTGVCALLIEWRQKKVGRKPSPALLKALLVNGAVDMAGGPDGNGGTLKHIPNSIQGWGRVNVENIILDAPQSSRGPKVILDQETPLRQQQEEHTQRVEVVDATRPLRVTLAWTDPPGAVNSSPNLVNDLDLEVTELNTGKVFKGNVFNNGFSETGGSFDALNNTECVYIEHPAGKYEVSVIASALRADARPPFTLGAMFQDYALVIDNARTV